MNNNTVAVKRGASGGTIWFIAIMLLKIAKVINWSWWFTFVVALGPFLLILSIVVVLFFFLFFQFKRLHK